MIKLTPPMGWNSWNTFGENINEKMILSSTTAGLYVNALKTAVLCRIRKNFRMV